MAEDRLVLHVTPYVNSWKVKAAGAGAWEFEAVVDNKEDAVRIAKENARERQPSQVKVHKADGTFEYESTYGDDPRDIPG